MTVEWVKRGEFNVGQECLVDLLIKNSGTTASFAEVTVDAFFPTNVRSGRRLNHVRRQQPID